MSEIKGAVFDLDGVLVDTAKYHYLAWKRLADELGFSFTEKDNERLKGVSRMQSLDILLSIGGIYADEKQKREWAEKKNAWYTGYLNTLDENALLPGTTEYLRRLKKAGIGTALGSASKNAPFIINKLTIAPYFDAVVDGNCVSKAKPDPEIFIKCAEALALPSGGCAVFEDSEAGISAAKSGGMFAVGIGTRENLPHADRWAKNLQELCDENFLL